MPRTRPSETRRRTATKRIEEENRIANRERVRRIRAAQKAAVVIKHFFVNTPTDGEGPPNSYIGTEALIGPGGTLAILDRGFTLAYYAPAAWLYVEIEEQVNASAKPAVADPDPAEEPVPA